VIAVAVIALTSASRQDKSAAHQSAAAAAPSLSAAQRAKIGARFDALPVAFEANAGQTDPQVKYMARGNGYSLFLTRDEAVFAVRSSASVSDQSQAARLPGKLSFRTRRLNVQTSDKIAAIRMQPVGGNSHALISPGSEVPGTINYYLGNDPSKWVQGAKQYSAVTYHDVYPGVNLAFHGEQRQLEFDFIVSPGANPAPIQLGFKGANKIATDPAGNLVLSSTAGDVLLHKPVAYQERDGKRELVDVSFKTSGAKEVAFAIGAYDRTRELVIDPSLSYASYLGGSAEDDALAIAVDGSGHAYVTGQTKSPTFGGKTTTGSNFNVFVTEFNSTGASLVYTSIFSGSGNCSGNAIAVDAAGNAFVGGSATSGFPTTTGAFQTAFGSATLDGFVLKLAANSGVLAYSTYLGGNNSSVVNAIAVDGAMPANAYVAGQTSSTNFPTAGTTVPQGQNAGTDDAFISKLNGTGSALVYSTYLGGALGDLATGIALDSSGNAYVSGITVSSNFPTTSGVLQTTPGGGGEDDGFVTEIKADGSAWVYSTYLGGSGVDDAMGIAVDAAGDAYVAGSTTSSNFPTVDAAQTALGGSSATNIFVSKVNPGATALLFSTFYGGTLDDIATGISLDSFADAYVTGRTTSSNYPVSNSFQSALSGTSDAFVTEFSNTGFVVYSSFLGGTGAEDGVGGLDSSPAAGGIAVDSSSNAFVSGITASTTLFPATSGAYQDNSGGGASDGFVAKVAAAPADFSVAVAPMTTSTTSGQSTSAITVTVSSVNASFGQAVSLSCGNVPSKAACSFTSGSVTPGSSAVTSSLTISTNGSTAELFPARRHSGIFAAIFLPVIGIAVLGTGVSTRRNRFFALLLGIALLGLMILPACGGGSGGGGGGGGGGTTTNPGTYTVTVIGTAGNTTHSAPLALTVN
jgi:hypothetical protein